MASSPRLQSGILAAALVLFGSPLSTPAADSVDSLTLDAAFARLLSANPTIVAERLRRAVDLVGVSVARERLNPEARVEFERETPKQAYSLALPLEIGRKRGRRIAVSEAALHTGEARVDQAIVEIRAQVRQAYFGRVIAEARLQVLAELQEFAVRARDAAQQRFDAGSAPRLEVLQAQLALAQAENEEDVARAGAHAAAVQLNVLLGYPLDAQITLATTLDGSETPDVGVAISRAQTANAELALLDRQIEEARARIALARSLRVPNVTPEATLTRDAAPEFDTGWRAAVGMTLPLLTTHKAGVRVEEAALLQLQAERDATLARITGEVSSAAALADAQRQAYLRYHDHILPQAVEVASMAEDSYRLGRTGIAAFLQALQASRDARLQSLLAASGYQGALADLERAMGTPIQ